MLTFLAQQKTEPLGETFFGIGPLGFEQDPLSTLDQAMATFNKVFSNTIGLMTIIGGFWFIFQFIIAAYDYLNAGGDMERIKNATRKITHAVLGLIVVVAAYAIISLLGRLIGLDILNPQDIIEKLGPNP